MENIHFDKNHLLTILRENRQKHEEIYKEALAGFKDKYIKELSKYLKEAKQNNKLKSNITFTEPKNYCREYDSAIRMLELCMDEVVVLDTYDFQRYVMDNWDWKTNFLVSNRLYSATASTLADNL